MTVLLSEQSEGKTLNIVYPEVLEVVQGMEDRQEDEFGSKAGVFAGLGGNANIAGLKITRN